MMTSPTDMEEDLLQAESTTQACLMHALHNIVSKIIVSKINHETIIYSSSLNSNSM